MLHSYCGGPEPMPVACRLNTYSRWQMEAAKQRTQVRAAIACKKEEEKKAKGKEGVSSSAHKVIRKEEPKRKADGKDDCPSKKVSVTPGDKLPKKPSPSKLSHVAGKGLMTTSGLVTQRPDCCLFTHKDYVVEVIKSIIKDKDVDPYAEKMTKELGASGLFDLAWAPVRMKALQDRSVAQKGVIAYLRKHNGTLTDE